MRLVGTFGEERLPIDEVDALVGVVDTLARSELAAPLRSAGLDVQVVGDARLPRDVTSAVAHAARAVDAVFERRAGMTSLPSGERVAQLTGSGPA